MKAQINAYIRNWKKCGYPDGIPDEVPLPLMRLNLAPSYQAICIAILKNDHALKSLGFSAPPSKWYSAIKRVEIEERNRMNKKDEKQPTFTFDIIGDNQKVFVGAYEAPDLERAVKLARKSCKTFTLPGWKLRCRETGNEFSVVQFVAPDGKKEFA